MAYIEMKDVSFAYPNGYLAVDQISIEVEKGDNIAIIGQNGAGKSTTVKMLNALEYPTSGTVHIGDMDTRKHTTAQVSREVGYVFQNPDDQIFHATVRGEVEFGPVKTKEQVDYALEITGMMEFAEENPYNLPLSMRKFVTIAAIIASDCSVMIFDEPTAGQDLEGNKRLEFILKSLHEKGKTVITISHDMEFVVSNFERVIVMANKKVIASGNPKEIFWNHQVLDQAMLKQPYISRLFHNLGDDSKVISLDDAVEKLMQMC